MGRSFDSIRLGVKNTSDRWMRVRRAMQKDDQIYAEKLAEMAKKHASAGFSAFDDPLEAAVFSVLVEMLKEMDHPPASRRRFPVRVKMRAAHASAGIRGTLVSGQ
jgi:hypothetical protein